MIRSMTAFAGRETVIDQGTLAWELRTVNHRYLEMGIRLPDELRAAEPEVRAAINARLGRGKLDAVCRFQPAAVLPVRLDTDRLERLLEACRQVESRLPQSTPPNAVELLRWPGVLQEEAIDRRPLLDACLALLEATLDDLIVARETEGEKIRGLLLDRCTALSGLVAQARARVPEISAALRERLETRLAGLDMPADPGRLEQELVFLAQKIDVDEEIDRLAGHIEEVRDVLTRDEPVGRRLDFLMQELNREANTLGSKSAALETTNISVELKVLIEQMREQVQNTE